MAELVLSEAERAELKLLSARRKTSQALALRTRIVRDAREAWRTGKLPHACALPMERQLAPPLHGAVSLNPGQQLNTDRMWGAVIRSEKSLISCSKPDCWPLYS
jgi:hypothetical protein